MELNKKVVIGLFIGTTLVFFIILSFIFRRGSSTQTQITPTSIVNEPTRFPTVDSGSQDELLREQTASDKQFGDWQKRLYEAYPWYDQLPLQSDRYFFYFDPGKKKFIGKLYPDTSQSIPLYEQLDTLKAEIRTKLQELQIPFKEEEIDWIVSPS